MLFVEGTMRVLAPGTITEVVAGLRGRVGRRGAAKDRADPGPDDGGR